MRALWRLAMAGCLFLVLPGVRSRAIPEDSQITTDEAVLRQAGYRPNDDGLLRFLKNLIPEEAGERRLESLVEQLGDEDFRVREEARKALLAAGAGALPALRKGAKSLDLEVRIRSEKSIAILEGPLERILPAALRLLDDRKPAGAVELLLAYLPHAGTETVVDEIQSLLARMAPVHPSDRVLFRRALSSPDPRQRGAAALALASGRDEADRAQLRKLLADRDDGVRLRAAQGLCAAGDSQAVPVLIELLSAERLGYRAEDLLLQLAGEKAPAVFLKDDAESTRTCRAGWHAWWTGRPTVLALPALDVSPCSERRSRAVAVRFLHALFQGDFSTIQQNAELPFNLAGILTLTTRDEFDPLFREVMEGHRKNQARASFQLLRVTGREPFLRGATPGERRFLERLPCDEIRVVYFRGCFGDDRPEEGAVWVHVSGCRARVIGFGRGQAGKGG